MRIRLLAGAIGCVAICGCSIDEYPFRCAEDRECVDGSTDGTCEANGYCSFPDSNCVDSKRRFGSAAPSDTANQCVPVCVRQVSAGVEHTCALRGDGRISCWGNDLNGQLGNGTTADNFPLPVDVVSDVLPAKQISAGLFHTCSVTDPEGAVWCWGGNDSLQLGGGSPTATGPVRVDLPSGATAVEVGAGGAHTCARGATGAYCWGANQNGQLGTGSTGPPSPPSKVLLPIPGADVDQLAVGISHNCVQQKKAFQAPVLCWGYNEFGQVAPATKGADVPTPTEVASVKSASDISLGAAHSCAVDNGKVKCWGALLMIGANIDFAPVDLDGPATHVAAGGSVTCALLEDGRVECWGSTKEGRTPPTLVDLPPIQQLDCGRAHCCAVAVDGKLWCWGENTQGQLGNGDLDTSSPPNVESFPPDSSVWKTLCE